MDIRVQELLKLEELIVLVPMDTLVDYGIICRTDISHKNDIGVNKYGSGAYSPICCFRACFICKNLDIKGTYVVIPEVSSERRKYVPMGYMDSSVLCSNKVRLMPNATLYHLGVLTSNVHMAWMRAVCGRLKSDYDYSIKIVYNNFPWPSPTEEQRAKIEKTAQAILDARALFPDSSLADLYDETTMPPELRKAHQQNDKAVMQAYGFWGKYNSESACVAQLMKLYQKLVQDLQKAKQMP